MARAYAGEPIYMDDIELTMQRHGHDEETHFSFFYAPVRGDRGDVLGGVLRLHRDHKGGACEA